MVKKKVPEETLKSIETTIMKKKQEHKSVIRVPSGCDLLDTAVGGGEGLGFPFGKIINIVGDKSSGKTFLGCEIIAATRSKYKAKLKWIYDDCESGFSFNTQNMYGFEIMPTVLAERQKSTTVEEAFCNIKDFFNALKDDEYGIYVIDSLDGIDSEKGTELADERYKAHQKGKEYKQGSYRMDKPKYLSQEFFPQLTDLIEKKHGLLIIISQVRTNIDPMSFEKYSRAGGKAMDFYCHTVLWLAQVNKIKKKNRAIGVTVKAKTTKSKTARPYREIFFTLLFDYGLDNVASNIDFLFDFLTPTGQLVKDPKAKWNEANEYSMSTLKQFLIDKGKEELYRTTIHPTLRNAEIMEWLRAPKQKKLFDELEINNNIEMSRQELINYVEENKLHQVLTERMIQKWEMIEASIRTNRPPKYSHE